MQRSKFTEEQITFALKQVDMGVNVVECCRKMGIGDQTFYRHRNVGGERVANDPTGILRVPVLLPC